MKTGTKLLVAAGGGAAAGILAAIAKQALESQGRGLGYSLEDFAEDVEDVVEDVGESVLEGFEQAYNDTLDAFDAEDFDDVMKAVKAVASGGASVLGEGAENALSNLMTNYIEPYMERFARLYAKNYKKGKDGALHAIREWIDDNTKGVVQDVLISFVDNFYDLILGAPQCMCEPGCAKPVADGLAEDGPYVKPVGKAMQFIWPFMRMKGKLPQGGVELNQPWLGQCLYLYAEGAIPFLPAAKLSSGATKELGKILEFVDEDIGKWFKGGSPQSYQDYKKYLIDLVAMGYGDGPYVMGGTNNASYYFKNLDHAYAVMDAAGQVQDLVESGISAVGKGIDYYQKANKFMSDTGFAGFGATTTQGQAFMGEWMPAELAILAYHRLVDMLNEWSPLTDDQRKEWKTRTTSWKNDGINYPAWYKHFTEGKAKTPAAEYAFYKAGGTVWKNLYDAHQDDWSKLTEDQKAAFRAGTSRMVGEKKVAGSTKKTEYDVAVTYRIPPAGRQPSSRDVGWPTASVASGTKCTEAQYWAYVNDWLDIHDATTMVSVATGTTSTSKLTSMATRFAAAKARYKALWNAANKWTRRAWVLDKPDGVKNPVVALDLAEAGAGTIKTATLVVGALKGFGATAKRVTAAPKTSTKTSTTSTPSTTTPQAGASLTANLIHTYTRLGFWGALFAAEDPSSVELTPDDMLTYAKMDKPASAFKTDPATGEIIGEASGFPGWLIPAGVIAAVAVVLFSSRSR